MNIEDLTEDFEILIVAWLKSGDENATNLANSLAKYATTKQLPIHGVMCSLNLAEIENLVRLKHYDDSDFGWDKKTCEEMREESRKAVGYTKADL